MNILVVSSCTKKKKEGKERAAELYQGTQHLLTKQGTELLRNYHSVDWYILSAKYGLIHEDTGIEPYDLSFTTMRRDAIRRRSEDLGIEEQLRSIIETNTYEKVFFLLGEDYLTAIEKFLIDIPIPSVFFTNREIQGAETIPCGINEAKQHHAPVISLKGSLFLEYIKKEVIK